MSATVVTQTATKPPSNSGSVSLLQRHCVCGEAAGLSGECRECKTNKLLGNPLQRKLAVNEPGDEYEREADRVAEQVLRMTESNEDMAHSTAVKTPPVQRKINASGSGIGAAPPIVHDVLSSPGQSLDSETRAFLEPRFGHDFGSVRVHQDPLAADSARRINALAYTHGHHIVFGSGQYSPGSLSGKRLLAHELCHVVQVGAAAARSNSVESPMLLRREDPRLEALLADLRSLGGNAGPYGTDELVGQIFTLLGDLDLSDPDNLAPVTQVVAEAFSDGILLQFLTFVEDRTQKERMLELPRSGRLGYGLFPVTGVTLEALGALASSFAQSSNAFLSGLYAGLSAAQMSEGERQALQSNLAKSVVINVAFPVVFLSGTLVGIGRDAKDTITNTIEILGNFSEFVDQMGEFIGELLRDQELARTLGQEAGELFIDKIRGLATLDPVRFTFELGRLVGPTIVYTVLSLLGIPVIAGAILFGRLSSTLSRFPRLLKVVEFIGKRLRARANEKILSRLLHGSGLSNRPPSDALLAAREALRAGTATRDHYEILLREAVNDARDFIRSSRVLDKKNDVEAASSKVLTLGCGPGRECSTASLAGMASESLRPIRIHRYQAAEVFGEEFHSHAFSVVTFQDGSQFLVDSTFGQFKRSFARARSQDFLIELVGEGFIPLTDDNVSRYAAVLRRGADTSASTVAGAPELAGRLRRGELAEIVDQVGHGLPGVAFEDPVPHFDRADLLDYAERTREELIRRGGQDDMVAAMEWLINRAEVPGEAP